MRRRSHLPSCLRAADFQRHHEALQPDLCFNIRHALPADRRPQRVDLEAAAANIGRSATAADLRLSIGAPPLIAGKPWSLK